jgi:hypothetical protein
VAEQPQTSTVCLTLHTGRTADLRARSDSPTWSVYIGRMADSCATALAGTGRGSGWAIPWQW